MAQTISLKQKDNTIVADLLNQTGNGAAVELHCREGHCGACRIKLIEGEVNYINEPLAFLDDNEIAACCAIPKGSITVESFN